MSAQPGVPVQRRIAWDLCAALLAYVVLRALVLHTAFDQVALWMYELYPMGTMAEFLQRGVDFPLRFYYDNAAGQILSGFLTLPAFALCGPSYLALKLVPFVLGIGVLLLAWHLLRPSQGRLAANLAVWSLVLAPTTYLKYSLTNSGNHFENLFFSLLAIAAFAQLVRHGPARGRLFRFGLAAGFALFVFLGALIPLGILLGLYFCLRGVRAALRELPWIGAGFLVGELPLLALNLATGGRGLGFLGNKFAGEESVAAGGTLLERIGQYLWGAAPSAATYPAALGVSGADWSAWIFAVLALTWLAALVLGLRSLARGEHDWLLLCFAAYVPLSALAYGISNLRLGGHAGSFEYAGYRYYLPLCLYGILAASALAAKAWRTGGAWRAGIALVPLGILLPGLSNLTLVDLHSAQTGIGSRYSGYDLSKAARGLLAARNGLSHDEQLRYLGGFPPQLRASVVRAIGFNLAVRELGQSRRSEGELDWSLDLCTLAAAWPEPLRREIARGAGIGMRFAAGAEGAGTILPALRRTLARASACGEELPAFLEGLASSNPALPLCNLTESLTVATNGLIGLARERALPEAHVQSLVRGQGLLFGQLARRGIPSDLAALTRRRAELPPEFQAEFDRGLGLGCELAREEYELPPLEELERALPAAAAAALDAAR